MKTLIRRCVVSTVWLLVSASAAPALAQGGYISASLVGDIARLDTYGSSLGDAPAGGEAFGFGLRVGSELGSRWGVELDFVRPGEISNDASSDLLPRITQSSFSWTSSSLGPNGPVMYVPDDLTLPAYYSLSFRSRQRHTTLSAGLWLRQEISPRFSLAYVGGVAFGRTSTEAEITYLPLRSPILPIPFPSLPPTISETTTYDVGPMVGVEGQIGLGGQAQIVPAIRLLAISGGWLIRPSLGLAWKF
jgi:hypothetical protein